ncbi:unnamed protein product [Chrysodeixis includens]|uniref:Uncharacterized protein n=1 Tax=Chrysodeixis includens TaxID=689277 RepID=A0A9N8KRG2_CHRIL|nr:unnamed protein product [Chrysodeixis includens]
MRLRGLRRSGSRDRTTPNTRTISALNSSVDELRSAQECPSKPCSASTSACPTCGATWSCSALCRTSARTMLSACVRASSVPVRARHSRRDMHDCSPRPTPCTCSSVVTRACIMKGKPALRRVAHSTPVLSPLSSVCNNCSSHCRGSSCNSGLRQRQSLDSNLVNPTCACSKAPLCLVCASSVVKCSPMPTTCCTVRLPAGPPSPAMLRREQIVPRRRDTSLTDLQAHNNTICAVTCRPSSSVTLPVFPWSESVVISMGRWPSGEELLTTPATAAVTAPHVTINSAMRPVQSASDDIDCGGTCPRIYPAQCSRPYTGAWLAARTTLCSHARTCSRRSVSSLCRSVYSTGSTAVQCCPCRICSGSRRRRKSSLYAADTHSVGLRDDA